MRKTGSTTTLGSLEAFSYAVSEIPWPATECAEVAVREWPGIDGEDAYIPSQLRVKPYDLTVTFVYKGVRGGTYSAYKKFRDWVFGRDGSGAEMSIYDGHYYTGRKGVYVKKIEIDSPKRDNMGDYAKIKVTMRVTDPVTDITLV